MTALILVPFFFLSLSAEALPHNPIHLDIEASTAEYEAQYQEQVAAHPALAIFSSNEDKILNEVMTLGKRNLAWLSLLNQSHEPDLTFTNPGTSVGYPMEKPALYSGKSVVEQYQKNLEEMPAELKAIFLSSTPLPQQLPVPVEVYIQWGQKLDKQYQTALRWRMMQPHLSYYARNQAYDIRGYFFLAREPDLENTLKTFTQKPASKQEDLKKWLISQCRNNLIAQGPCEEQFERSLSKNDLVTYFHMYLPTAQETYLEYFRIQNPRPDLTWENNSGRRLARLDFRDPGTPELRDFLKSNLEDEWRWLDGLLQIDFSKTASVRLIMTPDITPHVNGLGGNEIHMNSRHSLTEWDTQYTIRHELGHVLGFPDCYVEFYDSKEKTMVNYQIDTTDLMCSRAGRMNERLFESLFKEYH